MQEDTGRVIVSGVFGGSGVLSGSGLWLSFRNTRPELLGLLFSRKKLQSEFQDNILIIKFE